DSSRGSTGQPERARPPTRRLPEIVGGVSYVFAVASMVPNSRQRHSTGRDRVEYFREASLLCPVPPPRPGCSPGGSLPLCRRQPGVERGRALQPAAAPHGPHDLGDRGLIGEIHRSWLL